MTREYRSLLDRQDQRDHTHDDRSRWPGKRTRTGMMGPILRKGAGPGVAPDAEDKLETAGGSTGAALPAEVRARFEASLGADLGDVRVHTGSASAQAAASVGARAYAVGRDIHFAQGAYEPGSTEGQRLLAHEVAHTVQQGGGPRYKLEVSIPGDASEVEADAAADAMVAGRPAQVGGLAPSLAPAVQRSTASGAGPGGEGGGGAVSGTAPPGAGAGGKDPYQKPSTFAPGPPDGISAQGTIYFPLDGESLDSGDDRVLQQLVDEYGAEIHSGRLRVRIEGYADQRGDEAYNLGLSERRARAVDGRLRAKVGQTHGQIGSQYQSQIVAGGEDSIAFGDREHMAEGRKARIVLEPVPQEEPIRRPSGGISEEDQAAIDKINPLSDQWRARVMGGASGGVGAGVEVITIRIEDVVTGGGATFAYRAAGAADPGLVGESDWVPFSTKAKVHVTDFAGLCSHYGVSAIVAQSEVFIFNYPVSELPREYDEVRVEFKGFGLQIAVPGYGATMGQLEVISSF